jgi:hypothetical protein
MTPRESQYEYILHKYNEAYYRWLFCPENEKTEAKWYLDIWRHKWFDF